VKHVGFFLIALLSAAFISCLIVCDNSTVSNDDSIEMVWIPAGTFTIGSFIAEIAGGCVAPQPEHEVIITKGFYMGKYEITQAQYEAVMGTNPSYFQGSNLPGGVKTDKLPVERVNWYDAIEFCNALSGLEGLSPYYTVDKTISDPNNKNSDIEDKFKWLVTRNASADGYRLPTEAQWEYAAKGGNGTPGNFTFSGSNDPNAVAWHSENSGAKTHEVGTKPANGLGIYDMSGNVYEWCWDWYDSYQSGEQNEPGGAGTGNARVIRGGSSGLQLAYTRSTHRGYVIPEARYDAYGFRLSRP
jgi:formylglycine-generating enzyme required for sulfatase activity